MFHHGKKFLTLTAKRFISTSSSLNSNGILVLNCGSSSVKCQILEPRSGENVFKCIADRLNTENPKLTIYKENGEKTKEDLNKKILAICKKNGPKNTIRNIGLIMVLLISWKERKYPISASCPMPGVTALFHVKQRPAVSPVKRVTRINTMVCVSKFNVVMFALF